MLLLALYGLILFSGIRIVGTAKPGVDPEKLKKVAGVSNLKVAQIGGWLAIVIGGLLLALSLLSMFSAETA